MNSFIRQACLFPLVLNLLTLPFRFLFPRTSTKRQRRVILCPLRPFDLVHRYAVLWMTENNSDLAKQEN